MSQMTELSPFKCIQSLNSQIPDIVFLYEGLLVTEWVSTTLKVSFFKKYFWSYSYVD